MALQYLLAPTFQFVNTAGKPLSGGAYMEVYVHGTRTKYFCASDFNGTLHPFRIPLDSLGSNIVLANDIGSYDVYAYNRYGTLMMSRYNVKPGAGGGIGGTITSTDGSIDIHPTEDGVDLSVNGLDPSCLKVSADPRTTDGKFHFDTLVQEGDQAYVDNEGAIRLIKGWYHFTANVQLAWNAGARNETHQVTLYTTLSNSVIDFDISHVHTETIELSGDVSIAQDGAELVIGVSGMPTGLEASVISMDVHAITGKDGHDKYYAGNGITISNENYVAVDFDEVQEKLVAGSGVTIDGNVISAPSLVQVNSDWDATEGVQEILHKPDLSVYATKMEVNTGLAGKQNTIPDLAAIRSGAQAGASAVQPADLAAVATTGDYNSLNNRPNLTVYATKTEVNTGLAAKQDVISDLSAIRSGAQLGSTSVQPADLNSYATDAELTAGLSTKQDTINDLSTIRSGAVAGSTALQPSDVAEVAVSGNYADLINKPTIPTKTSDLTNDSGFITASGAPVQDVQVDGTSVVNAQGIAEITMPTTGVLDVEVDGTSVVNAQGVAEIDLSGYATTQALTTGLAGKEDSSNKSQTIDPSSTTEFPSSAATANFVNSSVATATANFLGNFTLTELGLTYPATDSQIGAALDSHTWPAGVTPTNNDYTYIEIQDPQTTGIDDRVERFKFNGTNWAYEYTLNNSSFTAAEKAAIDSGIDSAKVAIYDAHVANSDIHVTLSDKSTWNAKQDAISDLSTIRSGAAAGATAVQDPNYVHTDNNFTSAEKTKLSGIEAGAQVNVKPDWNAVAGSADEILNKPILATVATTGAYSDLSGTPTIPTVSDNVAKLQYGVATYAQVVAAFNAGKSIYLYNGDTDDGVVSSDITFGDDGAEIIFSRHNAYGAAGSRTEYKVTSSNVWSTTTKSVAVPTVDQSYSSSSANAQSGVAVAQAIAAIPAPSVDEVPDVTSGDDGKVLTASYSGGVGSYSWATAQAPISAGTGISITNNVVSVDYDTGSLRLGTDAVLTTASDYALSSLLYVYNLSSISTNRGLTMPVWNGSVHLVFGSNSSNYAVSKQSVSFDQGTMGNVQFTLDVPALNATNYNITGTVNQWDPAYITIVGTSGDTNSPNGETAIAVRDPNSTSDVYFTGISNGNKLAVLRPLPASTVADADKVLKVNSSGAPEWTTGGGDDGADWDAEQGEPGYIENKPVPKTLTAGTGISITENQSTITIANTAPDTVASLPTNLTSAQIQAFKEALGVDETLLWSGVALDATMSELPTNFERIRIEFGTPVANTGDNIGRGCIEVSMAYVDTSNNGSIFLSTFFNGDSSNNNPYYTSGFVIGIRTLSWQTAWTAFGQVFGTTKSTGNSWFRLNKVVGIHRVASN